MTRAYPTSGAPQRPSRRAGPGLSRYAGASSYLRSIRPSVMGDRTDLARRVGAGRALAGKAETAGITVMLVDERGTSSTCPKCSRRVPKPAGRVFSCPHCGHGGHRDLVAAASIAARTRGRGSVSGPSLPLPRGETARVSTGMRTPCRGGPRARAWPRRPIRPTSIRAGRGGTPAMRWPPGPVADPASSFISL